MMTKDYFVARTDLGAIYEAIGSSGRPLHAMFPTEELLKQLPPALREDEDAA
jgi:hypothetical protein